MPSKLHLHVLASGSKGNASIIDGPDGALLIDCGISRKQVYQRAEELGFDMTRIKGVLLTHEHSDHTKGLNVLTKHLDVPIFATQGTATGSSTCQALQMEIIDKQSSFTIAGIDVTCFSTSHDVQDPIGFRFSLSGDAIGFCTDTGCLSKRAKELLCNTRILALESNHDITMLFEGDYPLTLKQRVASDMGHLSNQQCANYIDELVGPSTQHIVTMHLSQNNNTPSTCIKTLQSYLGARAISPARATLQRNDTEVAITCAGQSRPLSIA